MKNPYDNNRYLYWKYYYIRLNAYKILGKYLDNHFRKSGIIRHVLVEIWSYLGSFLDY